MSLSEAINQHKQALANFESEKLDYLSLKDTRQPELKSRLNSNKNKVNNQKLAMNNAIDDVDYNSAKKLCLDAQSAHDDCSQMLRNVESKIKGWSIKYSGLQREISRTKKAMWQEKEKEVVASLPKTLPSELKVGLQKLLSIARLNESFGDGSYGNVINKVYGKAAPNELEGIKTELLTDMGLV
jgi:hypothetical protein